MSLHHQLQLQPQSINITTTTTTKYANRCLHQKSRVSNANANANANASISCCAQPCICARVAMQRGSDELLSQAAVMAPASDNNNQDLATKKAKLDSSTVLAGGIGKFSIYFSARSLSHSPLLFLCLCLYLSLTLTLSLCLSGPVATYLYPQLNYTFTYYASTATVAPPNNSSALYISPFYGTPGPLNLSALCSHSLGQVGLPISCRSPRCVH